MNADSKLKFLIGLFFAISVFASNIVFAENTSGDQVLSFEKIRTMLSSKAPNDREAALHEIGKSLGEIIDANFANKSKGTGTCEWGVNTSIDFFEDGHVNVRKMAYFNVNYVSYANWVSKKGEKPGPDLSKNEKFQKLLLNAISKKTEDEEIRCLAIQMYYVNFPYDTKAKEGVIEQFWKTKSSEIKRYIMGAIVIWQLAESEEVYEILLSAIKDDNPEVRIPAIKAISHSTPDRLLKPLVNLLDSRNFTLFELHRLTYAILNYEQRALPYKDILIATKKDLDEQSFNIENILKKLENENTP